MAGQLTIETRGLTELQKRLAGADKRAASETKRAMTVATTLVEGTMREKAPQDTRRLSGSIHSKISGGGINLTGVVAPSVRYAYWVEKGRGAGNPPPVGAISGWARRHGMNPYALARAIGRRGTRAQPFVEPTFVRHRNDIVKIFAQVGQKVASYIAG